MSGSWSGSATRASLAGRGHLPWGRQRTEEIARKTGFQGLPCRRVASAIPSPLPASRVRPSAPRPRPHRPPQALPATPATLILSPLSGVQGARGQGWAGRIPEAEERTQVRRKLHPKLLGPPGAWRPAGRDPVPSRAGAGVARRRPRGGTSSQWRWYSSMVAPTLPGGGALGGLSSAAAHWSPGRTGPYLCPRAVPTQDSPLCRSRAAFMRAAAGY